MIRHQPLDIPYILFAACEVLRKRWDRIFLQDVADFIDDPVYSLEVFAHPIQERLLLHTKRDTHIEFQFVIYDQRRIRVIFQGDLEDDICFVLVLESR